MTRDEQARLIAEAACDFVSQHGYCTESEGLDDCCENAECTYCALVRAMEGYDVEG
jgi:hypothetical protein